MFGGHLKAGRPHIGQVVYVDIIVLILSVAAAMLLRFHPVYNMLPELFLDKLKYGKQHIPEVLLEVVLNLLRSLLVELFHPAIIDGQLVGCVAHHP